MARSTWVAHAFKWEKLLKCHLKGKTSKKLANGQNIDYSEKRKRPKGFICPCTGVKYHNIQTCLLVYAADSGERLQDHWSSGSDLNNNILIYSTLIFEGIQTKSLAAYAYLFTISDHNKQPVSIVQRQSTNVHLNQFST